MITKCMLAVQLLLLTALPGAAQIVDVHTSTDNASPKTTIVSPSFSTAYANELLLACISSDKTKSPNTTVKNITNTGTAFSWSLVKRTNAQSGTAELWAATANVQVTGITVTATLSQGVDSSMTVLGFPSGSNGASGTGNGNPGAPQATLTTTANGSLVVGVGDDWDNAIARTVGSGQTLVHQYLSPVQDTYWVQMLSAPVALSGTAVTINDTAPATDRFDLSIVEITFGQVVPPSLYSVTGTAGVGGASVVLSGAAGASTVANGSGTYTFPGLANGTYSVTPSLAGYTFTPTSKNVSVSGANVTGVNFTASAQSQTFSISGTIAGSGGATVVLAGASSATTTTNNSGAFTFSGLASGSYTVTPGEAGYTFSPASHAVTINGANVAGIDFTATANPGIFSISGTIAPAAIGSGATVTLSGGQKASTMAGGDGSFAFSSLSNGAYEVTPSSTSATFSPTNQSVTINNASVTGIDFSATAASQSACGSTLNWTNPLCQQIGSGALNPQWTVISRHGEYAQNETECNIPNAIVQTPGMLTVTMTASAYKCGNFDPITGAACPSAGCANNSSPSSWPYSTGDIQWNTFNVCPDCSTSTYPTATPCGGTCTITIVGSMPSYATGTWPAFWLLGQNCQNVNKYTGDTGVDGCPNVGDKGYIEIDTTECYGGKSNWCQFHVANPSFGIGDGCDAQYPVGTGQHTFQTVWTTDSIQQFMDGVLETNCSQSIVAPMFFIAQIQSAAEPGQLPNPANLPAVMTLNSVTITDVNGNTLFSDAFPNQN